MSAVVDTRASTWRMLGRQIDFWWALYRRTFRGNAVSSFLFPLFNVVAMGVLLGRYVDSDPARLEGAPSYLAFVVPGLLVANAMMTSFGETTYPVLGMLKWDRSYYAMRSTPLRIVDLVNGHLGFVAFRNLVNSMIFLLVLAPFGVYHSIPGVLVALVAAVLTGAAFAAPMYAVSVGIRDESWFGLIFRVGLMPMFLFSGAFFPIATLSPALEWLARLTPILHGVDLARMGTVGTWETGAALGHIAYLLAFAAGGYLLACRRLTRRLAD